MEQINESYLPIELNMDLDVSRLSASQSSFIKNTRFLLNSNDNNSNNSGNGASIGSNVGKITPLISTQLISGTQLPDGVNKTIGAYEFKELNEIYWIVQNSNGDDTINLCNSDNGLIKRVYTGNFLNLDKDSAHTIPEHTVFLKIAYYADTIDEGVGVISNKKIFEKELIFTDGKNNIRQVNVLASIGSGSFNTDYYAPVYPHLEERADLITLAPIAPIYAPTFKLLDRTEQIDGNGIGTGHSLDKDLPNKLFNNAIQLSYQFIYTDERQSSVSMYSAPIIVGGTDCAEQVPETQPRCADVTFWVGNAHVEKINIFKRDAPDGTWTLYDTIEKFDCEDNINYWERDINSQWNDFGYNKSKNEITYTFCNNKQCTPVDQSLFTHIENSVPFASQALTPAGDALLLGNNLRDSNNLPCEIIERFSASVQPQPDSPCKIEKRKIVVYMLIKNATYDADGNGDEYGFLWGDNSKGTDSAIDGHYYFGGFGKRNKKGDLTNTPKIAVDDRWKDYKQYVPETVDGVVGGFVGLLAGTNRYAISTQVKFNLTDCTEENFGILFRDVTKMGNKNGSFDDVINALYTGEYVFLQKFVFEDVAAGKYVFRVAGHRTGIDVGYEKTSTYIQGSTELNVCDINEFPNQSVPLKNTFEWTIDVCNDGYNSLQDNGSVLILEDNTLPDFETISQEADNNVIDYNIVRELYVYEDSSFSIPCEMQTISYEEGTVTDLLTGVTKWSQAPLVIPLTLLGLITAIGLRDGTTDDKTTDHNGFVYHRERFWRLRTFRLPVGPIGIIDFTAIFKEPVFGKLKINYVDECGTKSTDYFNIGKTKVTPAVTFFSNYAGVGMKCLNGTAQKSLGTDTKKCDRVLIKGRLIDQNGKALTGITVGYEQTQFVKTDGFGGFKVYAHYAVDERTRCDNFIISNSGGSCQVVCVGCRSCCDELYQSTCLPSCVNCTDIIIDKGVIQLQKVNQPDKGLKGRYGIGVEGWDYYGRIVTGGVNLIDYFDINECWGVHPLLKWNYAGGLLPKEIKWLTFSITQNLNGTMLQWVADKFQLLDSEGNITTNKGIAQAVAVDVSSLINYNKNHNFNTLSTYQFVQGDTLKIIDDCDNPIYYLVSGTTFGTTATTALQETTLTLANSAGTSTTKTNFATDNGSTIIIPYDNQIDDLLSKCSIKIEIIRPYKCENNLNPFFEQIQSIAVIDGVPQINNGIIDAFDTYKIYRNIGKIKACTQNPNDDPYFSNNVTDFWGKLVVSGGRVLSVNPYAERLWVENEIAKSNEWINNGKINGLATFRNENVKNYKGQDWGGIVSIHAERNLLIVICVHDWFTAPYEYNYLKATKSGFVLANLSDNLGDPVMKVGKNFGCKLEHKSSIVYYEGMVFWFDSNNSNVIMSDYRDSEDIAVQGVKGWLISKNKFITDYNKLQVGLDNMFEVVAGFDPMHYEYHLTFRKRSSGFINNHREVIIEDSETIVYNTHMKKWVNFRGYTPEFYSKLRNAKSGSQFVSFANGNGYFHNNVQGSYNTFYGEKQTSVIEISVNSNAGKEKVFLSLTQESLPNNFFVDRILTSEKNSFSYIPQNYWSREENTFYSEILRDMSSYFDPNFMQLSTLIEGKRMFGKYALIRFVMIDSNVDTYNELGRLWCLLTGSELSGKPQIQQKND